MTPTPGLNPANYFAQPSQRDLASLLTYGPSFIPYLSAWTDNRIEQVRNFKHWIYIGIDRIINTVAAHMPNISWVSTGKPRSRIGKRYKDSQLFRSKALTPLQSHQHLEPVPHEHPFVRLWHGPNNMDTAYDFVRELLLFYYLTGISFIWSPRDPDTGYPVAMFIIPSHWMWPIPGRDSLVVGWEVRPVEGNYMRKSIPAEEITILRSKNPISKIDGFSPLSALAPWGDVQNSANLAQWYTYKHGTFPNVAVQFDAKIADPSDEDIRRIEAKFLQRYTSPLKAGKPLFLPPGVKVNALNIKPNEMVFGEVHEMTRDSILATLGVPPGIAFVGSNKTYGADVAEQVAFYTQTINPLLRMMGQTLTQMFARPAYDDDELCIWWEDRTPNDPEHLEKMISTDLMAGSITPNEIRLMRGRQPFDEEWADRPIMPTNMMRVDSTPFGGTHNPDKPDMSQDMPAPVANRIFDLAQLLQAGRNGHSG